mmetsp:Transcript_27448/g.87262  ORF Transcript_27448/g.87262 Transcript_27448/m.87262 type:complete len:398 (+) Transcript_27448:141-1334(+)
MVARNLTARATARHEDKSDAFRVGGSQHTQQFANLYFSRLKALAPTTLARARATWGDDLPFVKTLDAEVGVAVGVVGTLFADLGGKPDIMKEVTRDILAERPAEAPGGLYGTGDGDTFCLEDESGRISLSGAGLAAAAFPFATGAVIAVRGKLDPDGTLVIDDVCLPGAPPAAPTSVLPEAVAEAEAALGGGRSARPPAAHAPADKYVALASGLQIGGSDMEPLPLVLLSEFLTGHVGSAADLALQASIVRLVLCGNSAADVATTRSGPAAVAAAAAPKSASAAARSLAVTRWKSSVRRWGSRATTKARYEGCLVTGLSTRLRLVSVAKEEIGSSSLRVDSWLFVSTSVSKWGNAEERRSDILEMRLLLSRSILSRGSNAMHSSFRISLSDKSTESN